MTAKIIEAKKETIQNYTNDWVFNESIDLFEGKECKKLKKILSEDFFDRIEHDTRANLEKIIAINVVDFIESFIEDIDIEIDNDGFISLKVLDFSNIFLQEEGGVVTIKSSHISDLVESAIDLHEDNCDLVLSRFEDDFRKARQEV